MPKERREVQTPSPAFGPGPGPERGPGHRFSYPSAKPKNLKNTLRRLWGYFSRYKIALLGVFLLITISSFISIISPLLIQKAIDEYIIPKKFTGLVNIIFAMIVLYILNSLFAYFQGYGMWYRKSGQ